MKIQLNVLQLFSMLTVSLILSTSFLSVATAQYDSAEAAKTAATDDAKADTNKLAWFTTGLGCSILTLYLGGLAIDKYLSTFSPVYEYNNPELNRKVDEISGSFAASLIGLGTAAFSATYWFSGIYESSPPTARLAGKSPQYVNAYTDAYMQERKKTQQSWTFWGLAAGGGLGLMYLLSILE